MNIDKFNSITSELKTGINLIEASAGTGKTYTIAMLVSRFIVEKGLNIEQLLVVTFTKAATEELKDRIRARLAEVKYAVYGKRNNIDASIITWLKNLDIDEEIIKKRLEAALLNIDRAGIFTIHGFCQRILTEHALESGQLFDFELTADIQVIKQHCTDDYWRKQLYLRKLLQVSLLTARYKTPEDLLKSITGLSLSDVVFPKAENLDDLLNKALKLIEQGRADFENCRNTLVNVFADEKFKGKWLDSFEEQTTELYQWLSGNNLTLPHTEVLNLLSNQGLMDALNGAKFRKNKQQNSEERKSEYIFSLQLPNDSFNQLAEIIERINLHFRLGLIEELKNTVDVYLQQLNQLSFDDLISRLALALKHDEQQLLTTVLQQRFSVGLIDEFQDTDDKQWEIFSSLFANSKQYMYLIGDPKQAIYKFRGADIFSYFTARDSAQHHFTLAYNWRSHPRLVDAVNKLFARDQALLFENLPFHDVDAARKTTDGEVYYQQQAIAPMMLWQLEESESSNGYWTAGKAAKEIQIAVVNEILNLLNTEFTLNSDSENSRLKPKDIAILVRSNRQAQEYQAILQRQGVPAVLNSIESVFASAQAFELYQLLQAIESTGNIQRLKQALTLDWFGMDGQSFYILMNDESQLDNWVSRFSEYHFLWQKYGIMTMMSRLLEHEKVYVHLSKLPLAERILSNLHHLLELLQQVATEQHLGMQKMLEYFANAIQEAENGSSEEQQLRLESDEEAVKIVTMHRSKGLEYSVVFCPFLWQSNERLRTEKELVKCHTEAGMVADLGSIDFESHRQLALQEQLAEDLRILYVALTRAKYRCYIAWANVRSSLIANHSALAYLMDFQDEEFAVQQQKLQSFAVNWSESFSYQLLDKDKKINGTYKLQQQLIDCKVRHRQRNLETIWQMSSYTALAALSIDETSDLPEDKAQENDLTIHNEALTLELPKGSHTGNVIHSLLEFNSFNKLADAEYDISLQRERTCQRYGLTLEQPYIIDSLLQTVVSTPLAVDDENFCLKNLEYWQCIKEMPFYLRAKTVDTTLINQLLEHCVAFKPLTAQQLAGYLTGFIDLICEYNGRYYVMDYKTNHLPDYNSKTMIAAMREHNYGLQYWLYSLVLHLYLQNRLPNYHYEQHFGGVRYLFVRGMQSEKSLSGVYVDMPDLETLEALTAVFA